MVPVGSNFSSVTGAVWPTSTYLQLPVTKSQIKMRASSKPAITHAFVCEIDNETVLQDGFHFLNSVPLCRSYTTMKFGAGSFNSFVTTHTYDPSWVIALSDVIKSWCGIRRSYNSFRCDKCHTNKGNGFWVSSPQTRILLWTKYCKLKKLKFRNEHLFMYCTFRRQRRVANSKIDPRQPWKS